MAYLTVGEAKQDKGSTCPYHLKCNFIASLEGLLHKLVTLITHWDSFVSRDSNVENAKIFAELVDDKLARHYELDDSGKKKVRHQTVLTE